MRRWRPPDSQSTTTAFLYSLLCLAGFIVNPASAKAPCFNQIPQCRCVNDGLVYVKCRNLETESIPHILHPQLDVLEVTNSKLTSLSNADVYYYMQVINVTANNLKSLGSPLSSVLKLHTIVARENKLTALRRSDLEGLRSLSILDVSKNAITYIEDGTFVNLNLRELDLSQNRIKMITQKTLQGLENLTSLNLRDNDLTRIPPLIALRNLDFGDFSFNDLRNIEPGTLPNLRRLHLEGCNLDSTYFLMNSDVAELGLANNKFNDVPKPLPPKLETLVLNSNPISTLGPKSFAHIPKLRNFSLSSTKTLRSVHPDAFSANHEITQLTFEMDVSLTKIDTRMFRSMAKLVRLSFRESGLESLDNGFVSWYLLGRLDLRENPLRCDCRLSWLRDLSVSFANKSRESRTSSPFDNDTVRIKCAEPKQFRHLYVYNMPPSVFECKTKNLVLLILLPAATVLLVIGLAFLGFRYRHKLPFNKSKTAPSTSKPYFEKTYMIPADEYEGIYHIQRNAPVRLIPVTEL